MQIPTWTNHLVRATLLVTLTLALLPSAVSADTEIGGNGSGAGQVGNPRGVAVDESNGLLYVADSGNNRIDVFDADTGAFIRAFGWGVMDGTTNALQVCTTTCFKGLAGSGAGQFQDLQGIAVDNDAGSAAFHDVYVFENGNRRVQRFTSLGAFVWMAGGSVNKTTNANLCTAASGDSCGIGIAGDSEGQFNEVAAGGVTVGPGGIVYVGDQVSGSPPKSRIQKIEPSGAYGGQQVLTVPGDAGNQTGIAVDSGGNVYFGTGGATGAVRKYSPAGVELFSVDPSFNANAVVVGPAGELYVADGSGESPDSGVVSKIFIYSSTGTPLRTIYGSFVRVLFGMALYSTANGDIFTAELLTGQTSSGVRHSLFPPAGPVVYPFANMASPVGSTKATLNAKINPEGKATTYQFEYITDELFKAAGESFGAGTLKTPPTSLGHSDLIQHPAAANLAGLTPETLYHFRAAATNSDGGPNRGPVASFETLDPLELGETWATEVGTDSATLHSEANPLGTAAEGYFEYVDEASFEVSGFAEAGKAPDADAGAAPLDFGAGEALVARSTSLQSLTPGTTYRYRLVATDHCKADPEIVCSFEGLALSFATFSPSEAGETRCPANEAFRTGPAAFLPDCRAYEMVSPLDKNGADVDVLANFSGFPAGLDQAATDGQSIAYSTYKAFGPIAAAPYTNQYIARRDPEEGWLSEAISPKREGPSLMTLFSAHLDRQYKAFSDDLCEGWLVQDANPVLAPGGVAGFPGLYRRDNCGAAQGSYEALTTVEPPNVLPERFQPELQGTSTDGSVAIFSATDNLTEDAPLQPSACVQKLNTSNPCEPRLYEAREGTLRLVCILPNGLPATGGCGAGTPDSATVERSGSLSQAISSDGSRIFWSRSSSGPGPLYVRVDGTETIEISAVPAQFWAAAANGSKAIYTSGGKLFSFDVETETPTLIAEDVSGVAGASEDTSRIYFTSGKVLAPGATAGQPNLYFFEAGEGFQFVATLPSADISGPSTISAISRAPSQRLSRVTPDGEQIAFMSRGSLTGYDNTDAVSEQADAEVFLYDSTANGGAGKLSCVSCNPSGARPAGRRLTQKLFETVWAAARIPTFQSQLNGQRVLPDDGRRLYFNSYEGLVSHDTNGQEDVYQWEAPGSGDCTQESPGFLESSGGCLSLISSGESPKGSELVDIGTDGGDVFFRTSAGLVPRDSGLIDIYDAKVGGGFPPPEEPPAPCEGEACAPPAAAPNDPTPASAGFRGAGNPAPEGKRPRKSCPKGKRKVRKAGKSRCVQQNKRQGRKRHKQRSDRKGTR
jgi:hypothetical protein